MSQLMSQPAKWQVSWHGFSAGLRRLFDADPEPVLDYPFVRSDIALLYRTTADPRQASVDDQTWDDMLLDQYADQLARETSIFGRQILHRRLRECGADGTAHDLAAARVRMLMEDAAAREQVAGACRSLRQAEAEVSAALFAGEVPQAPRWAGRLWLLPLAFLVSVVVALFWWPAWLAAAAGCVALMGVQMRFYQDALQWARPLQGLQQLLRTHSLLGELSVPLAAPFAEGRALAGKLNRSFGRSMLAFLVPAGRDYSDWVMLKNVEHFFKTSALVTRHADFLRQSFLLVANLEADLALARHLLQAPVFCWAELAAAPGRVALAEVVHPLLEKAAPLSLALQGKGAFISGQNGIGKSTLLRTVGLNLIAARAFGFCYARSASVAAMPVYSSMQGEDSLAGGESLYIAELRRAKELLALAKAGPPAFFIIDEIFRGTNHLESISAAAAVLHTLARSGMVIVSSHNLVLAPLLEDCLTPLCVSAVVGADDGVGVGGGARLRVQPGVLVDTNGIALLAARGFGGEIEGKAGRVFQWLSGYLAQPTACAGVLEAPALVAPR